jgi:hypothetical protein
MNTICAYCGAPDAACADPAAKTPPPGDLYECEACGKLSVYTDYGLRKATLAEGDEASNDWRKPRSGLPTMIGFDGRG